LYNVKQDVKEQRNLSGNPAYKEQLEKMRTLLKKDLESFGRPFGEFVPGGNAAPAGLIDVQVELVKKMKIVGKKVTLPDGSVIDEQSQSDQQRKAAERESRLTNRKR
jgi:hypothetical protein